MAIYDVTLSGTLDGTVVTITVLGDPDGDSTYENTDTVSFDSANLSLPHTKTVSGFETNTAKKVTYDLTGGRTATAHPTDVELTVNSSPPSTLTASVTSDDISLSWDAGSNVDHYNVYRATSSGSTTGDYTQIDTVTGGTTTYDDTGLLDGERYYYRVSATYNDSTESSLSNEADATTALPAPTSLTASQTSNGVDLSWSESADNEDTITVDRRPSSGSYSEITSLSANTTSYSDTGATLGTEYDYRVSTETEHVVSPTSVSIDTVADVTLSSVSYVDGATLSVDWSGGDGADEHVVELRRGQKTWEETTTTPSTTQATVEPPSTGIYEVRVRARTEDESTTTVYSDPYLVLVLRDLSTEHVADDEFRSEWFDENPAYGREVFGVRTPSPKATNVEVAVEYDTTGNGTIDGTTVYRSIDGVRYPTLFPEAPEAEQYRLLIRNVDNSDYLHRLDTAFVRTT